MNGKRLGQIGAAVFVGLAVALTLVQLREDPLVPPALPLAREKAEADPLALQLRACGAMGEQALSSPDCRAAWAEKRRRFFGAAPAQASGERRMDPAADLPLADPTTSGSQ
ncbi:MAG: putative entry exclusion protein TrbK-alt [Agrobacterium tumefaciens]